MTSPIVKVLALILYSLAGGLQWHSLTKGKVAGTKIRNLMLGCGLIAVFTHALILYSSLYGNLTGNVEGHAGINLAFTNVISLVTWVIAISFIVAVISKPIDNLAAVIMPLAGIAILVQWLWPGAHIMARNASVFQSIHIIVSLIAYSLISLAAVQSLLLLAQEKHLHQKQPGRFLRALPPMQTMENLMVQMVTIGFLLLSLTVLSGIFFSEAIFNRPLRLSSHHTVLSLLAWTVFAIFLFGRWQFGWRGRTAVHWVLGGTVLLALGYLGTKFVLEILLGR